MTGKVTAGASTTPAPEAVATPVASAASPVAGTRAALVAGVGTLVGIAVALMILTKTVHPPAGSNPAIIARA